MPDPTPAREVLADLLPGVLVERYDDPPGPPFSIPRHVHDTYQLGIALDHGGEYRYRGEHVPVPVRRLVLLHPGEPHAVYDTAPRPTRTRYLMMYLEPEVVRDAARELTGGDRGVPFFPEMSPADPGIARGYVALFHPEAEPLEREGRLAGFLEALLARHARDLPSPVPVAAARDPVRRARDFLHDHFGDRVSLRDLARVAGLSPHHLVRAFRREVGVPPHAYQRQVRVEHAKRLIAGGVPLARVAAETGFYDQSHLGRHFRRLVGVTPGRYLRARQ